MAELPPLALWPPRDRSRSCVKCTHSWNSLDDSGLCGSPSSFLVLPAFDVLGLDVDKRTPVLGVTMMSTLEIVSHRSGV